MRKLIVLFCILSIAFASTVTATETRVMTMGEVGAVIRDDANVQTFPQTLRMYPNLGVAEIKGANFHTSGWHMTHGDFTMGGYWTTEEWVEDYLPMDFDGDGVVGLDQKFSLLYARDLSGMPFGFTFELFGNSEEHKMETPVDKSLAKGLGMKIGVGLTFMEKLETAVKFGSYSWETKDATGAAGNKSDGGTIIQVNARYWMPENDWGQMVGHVMFEIEGFGIKPPTGASTTNDHTAFDIGIGGSMPCGENIIMVHDMGIHSHSQAIDDGNPANKTDKSEMLLPYFKGGMESPLSEHFTLRCGGVKEWTTDSDKVGDDETLTSGANTRLYIGAGYKRGNFNLDLNLDPGFFTRGPYLISGAPGALASQVSMLYTW